MKSALILIALCLLSCASPERVKGAIINGSFELGPSFSGDNVVLNGGSTAINGWQVTGHSIDLLGSTWKAADGVRSLDLSGWASGGYSADFRDHPRHDL